MGREVFDVCLIGTGPATLLHGLARARAGQKVLFVDRGAHPGGGWHCPPVLGHRSVELGVHLIENRPHLNAVFTALPDVTMARSDEDFGLWRGRRISMRGARALMYLALTAKAAVKGRGDAMRHSARNAAHALACWRVPFLYPAAGFGQVLDTLKNAVLSEGCSIEMGRDARRVHMDKTIRIDTDDAPFFARHLVMTSRAHAPIAGMEAGWEGLAPIEVGSLFLTIDTPPSFGGYVEILGDQSIKRVRNITRFLDLPDRHGIVVQMRDPTAPVAANVATALARMTELGLLCGGTQVREHHFDRVTVTTLPMRVLRKIERRHGDRVTMLRTVDLSDERHRAPGAPQ